MYQIIPYKKLTLLCGFLCVFLIAVSLIYTFLPAAAVFSEQGGTPVTVIMYHQISENSSIWGDYVIPPEMLKKDFQYMKDNGFHPVSIEDLKQFTEGKTNLPKKAVLITFDDGERSFLTKVLPLLKEYNYPAVVSVVGALTDLYTDNGDTDDRYAYLNWNDMQALFHEPLVTVGNHTYDMHSLSTRRGMGKMSMESKAEYIDAVNEDFDRFNSCFTQHIGTVPTVLAYPYGIRNDTLLTLAKEKGITVTLTCGEKVNYLNKGDTLFELGRFNRPYRYSTEEFFLKITKI